MSLRRATPLTLNPRGLSDTLDGTTVFAGAMASLQNLIPDPSTSKLWQCRPAAVQIASLAVGNPFSSGFSSGFSGPAAPSPVGAIVCLKVIGNIAFGMAASDGGRDYPFAYNLLTNAFLLVTGATATNRPITVPLSGQYIPPTMDLVGHELLVTHPGFTGSGGVYFGWFDVADLSAITWSGGNLTGALAFTTPPQAIKNFNQRAYWATNPPTGQPALIFSDVLAGRVVTNANQVLTFDDNVQLTALAGLGLSNQLGGIIQALIVFKGVSNMFQVTGDAALNNLTRNALNVATGTLSPSSICSTPKGLAFVAPDGLRFIDFGAIVSDPVGHDGMGKAMPFIYSLTPSRVCAAANGSIIRITVQDASLVGSPWVEYWYDLPRQIWSGPHTFPARCISAWNNTFILGPQIPGATLWQSDYVQSSTSTFVENGTPLSFIWTSSMLPDTSQMAEYALIESTLSMALAPSSTYTVLAMNQNEAVIQQAAIANANVATVWGSFPWGAGIWGGAANNLFQRQLAWPKPVVFGRMQISVRGNSAAAVRIGTLNLRYQELGFIQTSTAA